MYQFRIRKPLASGSNFDVKIVETSPFTQDGSGSTVPFECWDAHPFTSYFELLKGSINPRFINRGYRG